MEELDLWGGTIERYTLFLSLFSSLAVVLHCHEGGSFPSPCWATMINTVCATMAVQRMERSFRGEI